MATGGVAEIDRGPAEGVFLAYQIPGGVKLLPGLGTVGGNGPSDPSI